VIAMLRVSHKIRISAPAERVWAVTTDIERWPEWLPTVTAARRLSDVPFGLGSRFELKQPFQRRAIWQVTNVTPRRSFTWQSSPRRMLRMMARHELMDDGANTLSRLSLACSGPLAVWLRPILGPLFQAALARENAALKSRCEAGRHVPDASHDRLEDNMTQGVDAT
jgi:carbon monoxide dehydrogenase subunit G